jgi:protein SCO1
VKARYALAALVVVSATALVAVFVLRDSEASAQSFRGSTPPPGITLPDFELRDYSGEVIRSRDLRGKVILVTFLETQCREACPIIASHIGDGLDLLTSDQRRQLVPLAISTHPNDDTPESVRTFLGHHRVEGKLRYLIGSEADLRPVWEAFAILAAFDSGQADMHSAPVRIYDRDGLWVSTLHAGADLIPENLAHDIEAALR